MLRTISKRMFSAFAFLMLNSNIREHGFSTVRATRRGGKVIFVNDDSDEDDDDGRRYCHAGHVMLIKSKGVDRNYAGQEAIAIRDGGSEYPGMTEVSLKNGHAIWITSTFLTLTSWRNSQGGSIAGYRKLEEWTLYQNLHECVGRGIQCSTLIMGATEDQNYRYNGLEAVIVDYASKYGRFKVKLDNGIVFEAYQRNLRLVRKTRLSTTTTPVSTSAGPEIEEEIKPGCTVKIVDEKMTAYSGLSAMVMGYSDSDTDGPRFKLKMQCCSDPTCTGNGTIIENISARSLQFLTGPTACPAVFSSASTSAVASMDSMRGSMRGTVRGRIIGGPGTNGPGMRRRDDPVPDVPWPRPQPTPPKPLRGCPECLHTWEKCTCPGLRDSGVITVGGGSGRRW